MTSIQVRSATELGAALHTLRRAAGLSETELADRLGCARSAIRSLESGEIGALRRLMRFVRFCGYDIHLVRRGS